MTNTPVDGFYLQYHAGTETKSVVIDLAVLVQRPVAQVVHINLAKPFVLRALDNGVVEWRLQQFWACRQNIYSHNLLIQGTGS